MKNEKDRKLHLTLTLKQSTIEIFEKEAEKLDLSVNYFIRLFLEKMQSKLPMELKRAS